MAQDRRSFLSMASQASGLVLLGALPARGDETSWRARDTPFTLGVASGDPTAYGFVLWTRLAPDARHGGGMPAKPVKVGWEVATDDGFRGVVAQWDLVLNQVPFGQIDNDPGPDARYDADKWDGYLAERRSLTTAFRGHVKKPVLVTGDMHANAAVELLADFDDERSGVVGTELIATSITSAGDGDDLPSLGAAILQANPHVRFFNGQRGYLRCTVTQERFTTDFRVLEYVKQPGSPVTTRASFAVEPGRPALQKA